MTHGTVNHNGAELELTQEAYCSNWGEYRATAKDAEGNEYEVIWSTTQAWDDEQAAFKADPENYVSSIADDESNACDWENPIEIRSI